MRTSSKQRHDEPSTPGDETRRGVGFFRGLVAVVRGTAHAVGTLIGLFGRGLAAVTRRSRRNAGPDAGTSDG